MKITFNKHGFRIDGVYFPCSYIHSSREPGSINIYSRSNSFNYDTKGRYDPSRKTIVAQLFTVENNSDFITDYFESDRIHITKDHPLYNDVYDYAH